jgi:16S rRNA processing protein RimM
MNLFASGADSNRHELKIEDVWQHQGRVILKFAGMDTISDAETLLGCELQVPAAERAQLEAGWTYISDLVGCTLLDGGREVGTIKDVRFGAGEAPLLIVSAGRTEYEIPFADAYLPDLDVQCKQLRMQLPEGMLQVNAPLTEEEKREQQKKSSR